MIRGTAFALSPVKWGKKRKKMIRELKLLYEIYKIKLQKKAKLKINYAFLIK